jgi:2-polyprenyl-3-methyl-5-hydroxy-6-metoxy-1,4-benzoquinol methylase
MSEGADVWPPEDLEVVAVCPLCGDARRERWIDGLTDLVFRAAPGRWTLWRCACCTAAYLDPRPTLQSIGRAYSAYYTHGAASSKHYVVPGDRPDLRLKRALHVSYFNRLLGHALPGAMPFGWLAVQASRRARVQAVHDLRHMPAPARAGAQLLDVGCGDGTYLRVARALGYEAHGIEFDQAAAALAQQAGFDVRVGAIESTQYVPDRFDQVTLNHVIEHLHDPIAVLARLRGWMRPGGRLWLQTPNIDSRGAQAYGAYWRGAEPPRHLVLFNARSLRLACERAGFVGVEALPPQPDAPFYIRQSEAMQRGEDAYAWDVKHARSALRRGNEWDRKSATDPTRSESLTMAAYKPAAG